MIAKTVTIVPRNFDLMEPGTLEADSLSYSADGIFHRVDGFSYRGDGYSYSADGFSYRADGSRKIKNIEQLFNTDVPPSVSSLLYNLGKIRKDICPSLLNTINIVYAAFVSEVDDKMRQEVFLYVIEQVRTIDLDPAVIRVFISNEPNHFLSRCAVSAYLEMKTVTHTDPFGATEDIVSMLTGNDVLNRGAVYAGLICFGDHRVCSIARTIKDSITPAEMRAFAVAVSSPLHRASIEFCLSWLIDLVKIKKFELAVPVAAALSSMVIKDPTLAVHSLEHNFGPYGFSSARVVPVTDYDDLLAELAPILDAITRVDKPILSRMIEIIREPRYSSVDQLERRADSNRRSHMEQRASDRRIIDIESHMERRSLQRRGNQRRRDKRR